MWSKKAKKASVEDITDFVPDITFYLDVEKEERKKRMKKRWNMTNADKLLIKEWWILDKTSKEYEKFNNKHIRIDTTNKTIEEVKKEILIHIIKIQQNIIRQNSEI
jgi:thymidylate kinase